MSDPQSYLEHCIEALPPQKREAARRAFQEISETGDDSYLSKLLAVLEANNAYAKAIPRDLVEVGGRFLSNMAAIADRLAQQWSQDEVRREAHLKKLIECQYSDFLGKLALDKIAAGIDRQGLLLDELNRSVKRPNGSRVAVAVISVLLFCLIGAGRAGWFFWNDYRNARQATSFFDRTIDAGIQMRLEESDAGSRLTIVGPPVKASAWQKDNNGALNGATIDFGEPR